MAAQICETCKKKGSRCYCPPNSTCGAYEPRTLTQFEKIKMMDIDEFTKWLDENGQFDGSPWITWFDDKYCKNCEPVICRFEDSRREHSCGWCELEGKCKYFTEMDDIPGNKEIIKMWLEAKDE